MIGALRRFLGFGISGHYGTIVDADRSNPGGYVRVEKKVRKGFLVEIFDCCVIIVHSSLIQIFVKPQMILLYERRVDYETLAVEGLYLSPDWNGVAYGVDARAVFLPFVDRTQQSPLMIKSETNAG